MALTGLNHAEQLKEVIRKLSKRAGWGGNRGDEKEMEEGGGQQCVHHSGSPKIQEKTEKALESTLSVQIPALLMTSSSELEQAIKFFKCLVIHLR